MNSTPAVSRLDHLGPAKRASSHWRGILLLGVGLWVWSGCASVPYTHRKQLSLISEAQEDQLGAQAYADVKAKAKISKDPLATAMVKRVGERIAAVSERPDYKWEFILIEEPQTVNAFCLPGGRVAVYSGLLPVAKDEAGLAVVMAHEVAHALARHGAERLSQQLAAGLAMDVLLAGKSPQVQQLVSAAYGIGVQLPFSRANESEADRIGLILMAKAGYDPNLAISFWERMEKVSGGQKPLEFLSTHPSDQTRIARIRENLPEALSFYKP